MSYIRDEIMCAATRCGVGVNMLSPERAEAVRKSVCRKYAHGHDSWLWEHFDECVVFISDHHWDAVGSCVGAQENLLFFNADDDRTVFSLGSGADLARILGECIRFEYYVTNERASFLIAVNHHNVVHAVGGAESALLRIKRAGGIC